MTDTPTYPDRLFLPPEAFDGYHRKGLNICGLDHVCVGDPHVEYVRLEAAQSDPQRFGIEAKVCPQGYGHCTCPSGPCPNYGIGSWPPITVKGGTE